MADTDAMHQMLARTSASRTVRPMRLTADHVALTVSAMVDQGPEPHFTPLEEHEIDALAARYDREAGDTPTWVFAYGSLIWKPDFDAVEHMRATAFGWHRSFCLKMTGWRGSRAQPGLMMALERGGRCDGVIYRLPREDRIDQIRRMINREIRFRETMDMARWIPVHTPAGKGRALVFWAGPKGERVASKLPHDEVARILARACGHAGSCAEYLYNTVEHLRAFGIHDRNLWRLQDLVAFEIERIHAL